MPWSAASFLAAAVFKLTLKVILSMGMGKDKTDVALVFAAVMYANPPDDEPKRNVKQPILFYSRNGLFYISWLFATWIGCAIYSGWVTRSVLFALMQLTKCILTHWEAERSFNDTMMLAGAEVMTSLLIYGMYACASMLAWVTEDNEMSWYMIVPLFALTYHACLIASTAMVHPRGSKQCNACHQCEELHTQLYLSVIITVLFAPSVVGVFLFCACIFAVSFASTAFRVRESQDVFKCSVFYTHLPWVTFLVGGLVGQEQIVPRTILVFCQQTLHVAYLCWVESHAQPNLSSYSDPDTAILRRTRCLVSMCLAALSFSRH